ncbi:MAG: helix-turn-helix transcriptional regulator [Elusimicrobiota bacterium]
MKREAKSREELLAGMQSLDDRLKKDLRDPEFKARFEDFYLEAVIAEKLHDLREKRHLTQKQLAAKVGMAQNAVSRLENGEHSMTLRTVQRIAAALGYAVLVDFKPMKRGAPAVA